MAESDQALSEVLERAVAQHLQRRAQGRRIES